MLKFRSRLKSVLRSLLLLFPVDRNLVAFQSFSGRYYSGSPKYLFLEMKKRHPEFKAVWLIKMNRKKWRKKVVDGATVVRTDSIKGMYYLSRARYLIANTRIPPDMRLNRDAEFLQTWHGTPLKKLALDLTVIHEKGKTLDEYRREFKSDTARWHYLISPNPYSTEIFTRCFAFTGKMLETGYPHNDIFFRKDLQVGVVEKVREHFAIPEGKKIILYAPTYRDDTMDTFKPMIDQEALARALGDTHVLLVRSHYFYVNKKADTSFDGGFAKDATPYDDVQELMLAADLLVTDYSSVMFDYLGTGRPMIFYQHDYEEYKNQLRGMYFDFEKDAPGPIVRDMEGLIDAVENIDRIRGEYAERYKAFKAKFAGLEDGKAGERVLDAFLGEKR